MDAPQDYKNAGIMMLIGGVINVMMGGLLFILYIWICIGIFWLIPMAVGLAEIVVGVMMLQGNRVPNSMIVSILGIVGGLMNCNWIAVILEILAIVFTQKPEVQSWLRGD